jgi:hypothetical protein
MTDQTMDVAGFIEARRQAILSDAERVLAARALEHYRSAGQDATAERLRALLDIVVVCCRDHRIEAAIDYASGLAVARHAEDHRLEEVQTAINTLEESVWRAFVRDAAPDELGYGLGLVSTVLGTIKDRLACAYVAQVATRPPSTLRLEHLFEGFEGDVHPG